jgi:ATP-dependent RNA helicase SUPV3L1/SUV3
VARRGGRRGAGPLRRNLLHPRARLLGELGEASVRERAERRLDAFLAGEVDRKLHGLRKLERAWAAAS